MWCIEQEITPNRKEGKLYYEAKLQCYEKNKRKTLLLLHFFCTYFFPKHTKLRTIKVLCLFRSLIIKHRNHLKNYLLKTLWDSGQDLSTLASRSIEIKLVFYISPLPADQLGNDLKIILRKAVNAVPPFLQDLHIRLVSFIYFKDLTRQD